MPSTMTRFKKKIVSAGKHNAVKNGSTREMEEISPQRIKHWVDSFNQMKSELSYQIPNPAVHYDATGKPVLPVTISESGELIDPRTGKPCLWDSNLNLGFWDKLYVDEDGDLSGEVEAPGDPSDPNTPAGKIGTTIKQTSIGAAKEYKDGNGKVWKDVLCHIASPIHAVEPNQKNFIPVEEGEFSLMSMSTLVGDYANSPGNTGESTDSQEVSGEEPSGDIKEVLKNLKEIGIDLPEDTTEDNLVERLGLALRQKIADDKEHDGSIMPKAPKPADPSKQPPNSVEKPGPGLTTMSDQKIESSDLTLDMTMSIFSSQKKDSLKDRLNKIVEMGALSEDQKTSLFSELEMFTMSQADFDPQTKQFKKSTFEFGLDCMEAVLANLSTKIKALKDIPDKDKLDTTMSQMFTKDYDPSKDVVHDSNLDDSGSYEPEDEDSPFMQGALNA